MKRDLRACRVLVVGASSGIGYALAKTLAMHDSRLVVAARSMDRLQRLVDEIPDGSRQAHAVAFDITSTEDRQRLLTEAVDFLDGLDVLINCAGIASWAHFGDSGEEILRRMMEVNFFGPAELIRLAVPQLEKGRQPAVVNVASMCARRGMPAWSEYSASKFALCGLSEALQGEFVRYGIDVLLVLPGLTRTGLHSNMLKAEGRAKIDFASGMPAEKVANAIVRALQNNRRETVVGRDARWMLRVNRFFPRLVDRLIARHVRKLYSTA